jgi:hypothetical protein
MASFSRKEGVFYSFSLQKRQGVLWPCFSRTQGSGVCMEVLAYTATVRATVIDIFEKEGINHLFSRK